MTQRQQDVASCGDSGRARVGADSTVVSPNLPETVTGNSPFAAVALPDELPLSVSEPHAVTPTSMAVAARATPIRRSRVWILIDSPLLGNNQSTLLWNNQSALLWNDQSVRGGLRRVRRSTRR